MMATVLRSTRSDRARPPQVARCRMRPRPSHPLGCGLQGLGRGLRCQGSAKPCQGRLSRAVGCRGGSRTCLGARAPPSLFALRCRGSPRRACIRMRDMRPCLLCYVHEVGSSRRHVECCQLPVASASLTPWDEGCALPSRRRPGVEASAPRCGRQRQPVTGGVSAARRRRVSPSVAVATPHESVVVSTGVRSRLVPGVSAVRPRLSGRGANMLQVIIRTSKSAHGEQPLRFATSSA
jgi:hypothetical protein